MVYIKSISQTSPSNKLNQTGCSRSEAKWIIIEWKGWIRLVKVEKRAKWTGDSATEWKAIGFSRAGKLNGLVIVGQMLPNRSSLNLHLQYLFNLMSSKQCKEARPHSICVQPIYPQCWAKRNPVKHILLFNYTEWNIQQISFLYRWQWYTAWQIQ